MFVVCNSLNPLVMPNDARVVLVTYPTLELRDLPFACQNFSLALPAARCLTLAIVFRDPVLTFLHFLSSLAVDDEEAELERHFVSPCLLSHMASLTCPYTQKDTHPEVHAARVTARADIMASHFSICADNCCHARKLSNRDFTLWAE